MQYMEDFPIEEIDPCTSFPQLSEIPQPPRKFFMRGSLSGCKNKKYIAIVGSRAYTSYGLQVCKDIISGLRGYPVVIVSGLALGIDAVAHRSAIENDIITIALPGSGLGKNVMYPSMNRGLAEEILKQGGALLSEFENDFRATPWSFPKRNRIVSGIADIIVVIEAKEKSGALITARLGTEYNKIVGAVPGTIYSESSKGANWLLSQGAVVVRSSEDILRELGIPKKDSIQQGENFLTKVEKIVLGVLTEPLSRDTIIEKLNISPQEASILFSSLEIKGVIRERYGKIERY